MFGETTISYVKIRNHPIETTIHKWLFGVPGIYIIHVSYGMGAQPPTKARLGLLGCPAGTVS